MPQLSKFPLDKQIEVRVKELLSEGLTSLSGKEEVESFLVDLLTPTEKVMLSKRLAIAMLLEKKYSYRQVARAIKVSTSTIRTVANWRKLGGRGYRRVIVNLVKQDKWKSIFTLITDFVGV